MEADDLDRLFSNRGDIVPSSGFTANVMEGVRREASTPPPIPFPWRRLAPAVAVLAIVLPLLIAGLGRDNTAPADAVAVARLIDAEATFELGWIGLALALSLLLVKAAMRMTGRRG